MTPRKLAENECANYQADGTCLLIQPSWLDDYSLPLPEWLDEERWRALVDEALAEGRAVVRLRRVERRRQSRATAAKRRHLDLCYCLGCGRPMGVAGKSCLDCRDAERIVAAGDVDRRCKVARGDRCRWFEKCILPLADGPSADGQPKLQRRRAEARRAYLRLHKLPGADATARACPDCGEILPKRRRICDRCHRERTRERVRRHRRAPVTG